MKVSARRAVIHRLKGGHDAEVLNIYERGNTAVLAGPSSAESLGVPNILRVVAIDQLVVILSEDVLGDRSARDRVVDIRKRVSDRSATIDGPHDGARALRWPVRSTDPTGLFVLPRTCGHGPEYRQRYEKPVTAHPVIMPHRIKSKECLAGHGEDPICDVVSEPLRSHLLQLGLVVANTPLAVRMSRSATWNSHDANASRRPLRRIVACPCTHSPRRAAPTKSVLRDTVMRRVPVAARSVV